MKKSVVTMARGPEYVSVAVATGAGLAGADLIIVSSRVAISLHLNRSVVTIACIMG